MVNGSVSIISIGLTIIFRMASTNAKIIAVYIVSICTPDNTLDNAYANNAVINKRIINLINKNFVSRLNDHQFVKRFRVKIFLR